MVTAVAKHKKEKRKFKLWQKIILIIASVMVYIFCLTKHISRGEGVAMILFYIAAVVYAALR